MLVTMKRFFADRRGAFAMQFALLVVPLTVCTGLAIDGGRAFLARYELASAIDAAALAVGSTTNLDADLNTTAHKFVNANFHSAHSGPIELELEPTGDKDETVILKGRVTIDTYFMPLIGQPTVTVAAESQVKRGGKNIEVALALDITKSMDSGSPSRISALRTAAKNLVTKVVSDVQTPYTSKVAIAPWANNVHVGADWAEAIRGPLKPSTPITGAHWRNGTGKTISSGTGWRKVAGGNAISTSTSTSSAGATWRYGSQLNISGVAASSGRIQITTTNAHGYANGDTVHISGITTGSYAFLNGNSYKVANRTTSTPGTFTLQQIGTTTDVAPPASPSNSTNGVSQRCFNTGCEVRITTSSTHAFAAGDYVHISGVSAPYGFVNNANESPWVVSALPAPTSSTTFYLAGSNGPSVTSTSNGANGRASECYNATCKFVVTANGNGFANGDYVAITGASVAGGGGISMVNTSTAWTIGNVTTNTFELPGEGPTYRDWTSGGTASECWNAFCQVRIISADHGLATNDYVEIKSVGGFTGVNNTTSSGSDGSWVVASVPATDTFYITGWGPSLSGSSNAYSANTGTSQCVMAGCLRYRYTSEAGTTRIRTASNCITERVGAEAYTDAAPSTAFAGRHYPGSDSLTNCEDSNMIVPLTSTKKTLTDAIDAMQTTGSTAGEIGAAWGWYMLSPKWAYLWPEANRPLDYDADRIAKVVVLMTDGQFNTAHCNGVQSATYAYNTYMPDGAPSTGIPYSDRINCDPAETPFEQAMKFCEAMKAEPNNIIIYTVGFQLAAGSAGVDFLEDCATDGRAYLAATNQELQDAFDDIATSISRLRIAR